MLAESSEKEPQTDGSPICECGKETFGCSIHPNTRDEWVSCALDSLAKTLAALGHKPGSQKEREAAFIEKCSELLMWYDPDICSWKMSPPSSKKSGYKPSSKTLPLALVSDAGLLPFAALEHGVGHILVQDANEGLFLFRSAGQSGADRAVGVGHIFCFCSFPSTSSASPLP